jgi:adenylate kinase
VELVVLLGAPGSGKGTVAARLVARRPGLALVAAGDLLREAVKCGTPAGRTAGQLMRQGGLVPDELIARLIGDRLSAGASTDCYLLDGFPRTAEQVVLLDAMAGAQGAVLRAVILLDVPEDVILERLAGRRVCPSCARVYHVQALPPRQAGLCDVCASALVMREDDRPETVRNRLMVYGARTLGLIGTYQARGLLRRIDGVGSVDEVADRIDRALT